MSEGNDDEDKTEDPTSKKLREARDQGQVVQSREVNTWVMLFASALLASWGAFWLGNNLTDTLRVFLERPESFPTDGGALAGMVGDTLRDVAKSVGVPLVVLFIAALVSGFAQVGPLLSTESIMPSLSKINPLKGAGRLLGARAWIEFIKAFIKMLVIGTVTTMVLIPIFKQAPGMVGISMDALIDQLMAETKHLFIAILVILFMVAALDYGVQYFQMMKQLRMSKQEIRDEYKQSEGDPHIKMRLREIRLKRARKRMMAQVPKADVVITNPTHYAMALQYDQTRSTAPMVVAKGADQLALKIRQVAKENDVPIVENPPLARTLFDTVDLDEEIPETHYKAVAEIISYVYSLRKRRT